jgi:hypothetical protein
MRLVDTTFDESLEAEPFGDDASVQVCLQIMREVAEEQLGRTRNLDLKASSVAGFAATVLTLNLTLGLPLLEGHWGTAAHAWIRDFFIASSVMFAAAAIVVVAGVLRPVSSDDLDETAIDGYADRPKVITPPPELRIVWLQTVSKLALSDREVGNAKAKWSSVAVILLALGILGLLGQALVVGVAS